MNRRVFTLIVIAALLAGVGYWWNNQSSPRPTVSQAPPTAISTPEPPASKPEQPAPAPEPAPAPTPQHLTPELEIEMVSMSLEDFRRSLGENPVGSNAEITASLLGDNSKNIKLPLPNGAKQNDQGELCDRWGTPYFFHQQSKTEMQIRSAGPDRKMWTNDDIEWK